MDTIEGPWICVEDAICHKGWHMERRGRCVCVEGMGDAGENPR